MQLAQPTKDFDDPNKGRIIADDHQGETAFCPLCAAEVVSVFENGIWQWIHKSVLNVHAAYFKAKPKKGGK